MVQSLVSKSTELISSLSRDLQVATWFAASTEAIRMWGAKPSHLGSIEASTCKGKGLDLPVLMAAEWQQLPGWEYAHG